MRADWNISKDKIFVIKSSDLFWIDIKKKGGGNLMQNIFKVMNNKESLIRYISFV